MPDLKFHVWHAGDRSVGIDGESAEITFPIDNASKAVIEDYRARLTELFQDFWDMRHVAVMTDAEINAEGE